MKRLALLLAFLATVVSSPAIVISNYFDSGFANVGVIPDNNFSGWANTQNIDNNAYNGLTIVNVEVTLNISGGWNGDLYGYLTHSSGTVVLLNRPGSGAFSYAGYDNITLSDLDSLQNINNVATPTANTTYNSYAGTLTTAFAPTTVNGDWTLFLADLSGGDVSTLNSWSLTITAVPEPTTWAAIIFGGVFGAVQFIRYRRRKA